MLVNRQGFSNKYELHASVTSRNNQSTTVYSQVCVWRAEHSSKFNITNAKNKRRVNRNMQSTKFVQGANERECTKESLLQNSKHCMTQVLQPLRCANHCEQLPHRSSVLPFTQGYSCDTNIPQGRSPRQIFAEISVFVPGVGRFLLLNWRGSCDKRKIFKAQNGRRSSTS